MTEARKDAFVTICGRYRPRLIRDWTTEGSGFGRMVWIMLNPSTADADVDDQTIRKCMGFAESMGLSRIDVVNLYSWRATDPRILPGVLDPVGPGNDECIRDVCTLADVVVCGWGLFPYERMPGGRDRANAVADIARSESGKQLMCVHETKGGFPGHPLYVPYGELRPWGPEP